MPPWHLVLVCLSLQGWPSPQNLPGQARRTYPGAPSGSVFLAVSRKSDASTGNRNASSSPTSGYLNTPLSHKHAAPAPTHDKTLRAACTPEDGRSSTAHTTVERGNEEHPHPHHF